MSDYSKIRFEVDGPIGVLTFDSPSNLNALDYAMLKEVNLALDSLPDSVRVLILTGAGEKAFIAGGDIGLQLTFDVQKALDWADFGHSTLRRFELLPIPVIGAVNGYALGGGTEVALACDFLTASENAVFGQPEVSLGITPGFGGTQRLPRKVGMNRAKELILTGRRITAAEALSIGLVSAIAPQSELMAKTKEMALTIASYSPEAVRQCKTAIDEGMNCDLDRGLALERALFVLCFSTQRQKEDMTRFVERRGKKK
jgi:enoyl-CoA hydratase